MPSPPVVLPAEDAPLTACRGVCVPCSAKAQPTERQFKCAACWLVLTGVTTIVLFLAGQFLQLIVGTKRELEA
eukprot:SAG22_NODE_2648_length_2338_cov_1.325145_2_plen_72_part_01